MFINISAKYTFYVTSMVGVLPYPQKINMAFISVSSGMLSQDDFNFISRFDVLDQRTREAVIKENPQKLAKTFLNLLSHISKDTTIQYVLTLLDDILQVQHSKGPSKQHKCKHI